MRMPLIMILLVSHHQTSIVLEILYHTTTLIPQISSYQIISIIISIVSCIMSMVSYARLGPIWKSSSNNTKTWACACCHNSFNMKWLIIIYIWTWTSVMCLPPWFFYFHPESAASSIKWVDTSCDLFEANRLCFKQTVFKTKTKNHEEPF